MKIAASTKVKGVSIPQSVPTAIPPARTIKTTLAGGPRRFPFASGLPKTPVMIPDEILDYYGWVFCQRGFRSLRMTFEQFLAVVAVVSAFAPDSTLSQG